MRILHKGSGVISPQRARRSCSGGAALDVSSLNFAAGASAPAAVFSGWSTPPDIVMSLPMPPSTNDLLNTGGKSGKLVWSSKYRRWYPAPTRTTAYSKWLADVEWLAIAQRCADQIRGEYALRVTAPRSRKDVGNLEKALSDGLQRMRVVANDRHARSILLQVDASRAEHSVLVELWGLAE